MIVRIVRPSFELLEDCRLTTPIVTDLECVRIRELEKTLFLSQPNSSTFPAISLPVAKDSVSKWDVGAMAQGSGHAGAEKLKCTSIFISFRDTTTMEIFPKLLSALSSTSVGT